MGDTQSAETVASFTPAMSRERMTIVVASDNMEDRLVNYDQTLRWSLS